MKLLKEISIKNLKLNKKRSVVTIIGILLSVALITAVAAMVTSFRESIIEYEKQTSGNYHYSFSNVPTNEIDLFKNNRSVENIFVSKEVGYAKINSQNEYKPYAYILEMDKKAFENLGINIVEGRLPENENEIVIPTSLQTNGRIFYKIGDKITLDVGRRMSNGYELNQSNPFDLETQESILDTQTKEYIIVGISKRLSIEPYTAPGYTFLTYLSNKQSTNNIVYVSLTKNGLKNKDKVVAGILGIDEKIYSYKENAKTEEEFNAYQNAISNSKYKLGENTYLVKIMANSFDDGTMKALVFIASIVIVIIILTSVFCIKNSFNISYTEKIKSYANLISVGATSKQIKKSVYYENFILGIIGIILGLFSGIFAAFILINIVNKLLGSAFVIEGFLIFKINLLAIIISIILSILTIFLSSRKVAKKASKIPPIEALRNPGDIKIKSKKIRCPKIINKIFGVGGVISYKNIKRNSKKYRATVISIIFCTSVYIGLSYFINTAFGTVKKEFGEYNYNIEFSLNDYDNKKNMEKNKIISSLDGINRYSIIRRLYVNVDKLEITNKAKEYDFSEYDNEILVISVGEMEYKNYLKTLNLEYEEGLNAIIINNIVSSKNGQKEEYNVLNYNSGDTIHAYSGQLDRNLDFKIIKSTSIRPLGYENNNEIPILVISDKQMDLLDSACHYTTMYIDAKNPNSIQDEIEKMFNSDEVYYLSNIEEAAQQMNSLYLIISIFLYGFIIVIAIIGITNIFNTITTNIALRQSEFASLRSIGMTSKEFNKMIFLESFFYCTKALIIGIPIGILLSLLICKAFSQEMSLIYHLPIKGIIISTVVVFILIFSLMKYSTKKVNSKNILDLIRNENI